ncbi:MAG TPA: RHS repeat-associated core domain-containing protein [Mycobacteriales bacterium]|nr:RHS repeat-associated core domain-containing protein [Mycobacteriales bacterium]
MRGRFLLAGVTVLSLTAAACTGGSSDRTAPGPITHASGQIRYAHDQAGRLTAAFDSTGAGVRYTYDADDNVTAVTALTADKLTVVQAGPDTVVAGGQYTVYGTGFGAHPDQARVRIGGADVPIRSAQPGQIVVEVPASVEGGQVSLTADGHTVEAGTVTVLHRPAISSISDHVVDGSGTFTVTGSGFDAVASRNTVTIGGTRVQVRKATESELTVRAPGSGGTGKVSVRNRAGSATSDRVVTVVPSPFLASDVAAARALEFDRPAHTDIKSVNQLALFYAEARAGQRVSFQVDQDFPGCVEVHLWAPDHTLAFSQEDMCGSPGYLDVPGPAAAGYYLLEVDPRKDETGPITVTAKQSADSATPIRLNGQTGRVRVGTAPGHALFTFTGRKGNRIFTAVGADAAAGTDRVTVRGPSGQTLATSTDSAGLSDVYLPAVLPENGVYTVDVDPRDWERGSFTTRVNTVPDPIITSTSINGPPATITTTQPGQSGSVSFQGKRGQVVHLAIRPRGGSISSGNATLRGADGSFLFRDQIWDQFQSESVDRYTLPKSGEYLILLEPDDAQAGSIQVAATTVPKDVSVAGRIDGPARSLTNSRPGQDARLTFTAKSGRRLLVTCATGAPDGTSYHLLDPSGDEVDSAGSCDDGLLFATDPLEASGRYSLVADFPGSAVAAAPVRVRSIPADRQVNTTPNSPATAFSLAPGQGAALKFPVAAGRRFLVTCSLGDEERSNDLSFTLQRNGEDEDTGNCADYSQELVFDTTESPNAAMWQVVVSSEANQPVALRLRVRSVPADLSASTRIGGSGTHVQLATGQNGKITFAATSGQRFLVACSLDHPDQQYDIDFTVEKPGGDQASGDSCFSPPAVLLDTTEADSSGTWAVTIDPSYAIAAGLTVHVYAVPDDVEKSTSVGAAAVPVTLVPGQSGQVHFQGRAGQQITVSTPTSSLPSCRGDLKLLDPDGNELESTCQWAGTDDISHTLPSDGTYTALVDPEGLDRGSVSVRVRAESGGHNFVPRFAPIRAALTSKYPVTRPASLAGRILRTDGKPIGGVTVRVADHSARTGPDGRFRLNRLPAGTWLLAMDGRTASTASTRYGYFDVQVGLHTGRNTLPYQPYLPILDTAHEISIHSPTTRDVVLRTPKVPGLEVHIPKGTRITDADGKPVDHLGITPIPVKRTPIPMPKGVQVPVYFTVQPSGGEISGGKVQIYYPNYLNQKPGTEINFWTHEKRAEGWEVYGKGYVNGAGDQVIPDSGTYVENFDGAMINVPGWLKGLLRGVLEGLGAAGDPVDLGTGRFTYSQTDISLGGNIPLTLERGYSSGDGQDRSFGIGTFGTYDTFLTSDDQWNEADLNLVDGTFVHFVRTSPGTGYTDAIMEARTASPDFAGATLAWNGAGWDLTLRDGTVLVYGELAPLQSIRDRFGHSVMIRRSSKNSFGNQMGSIVSVTSSDGYWLKFDYDKNDHITAVQDNAGRTVKYGYDDDRLTSVQDVGGGITRYGWDSDDRLISITDAKKQKFLTNTYDDAGRVVKQVMADGSTYHFGYQVEGGRIVNVEVTDPSGRKRSTRYDARGFMVSDRQAVGTSLERGYTIARRNGVPVSVANDDGQSVRDTTDQWLRATSSTTRSNGVDRTEKATYNGYNGAMDSVTDSLGKTTKFGYDNHGNIARVTDPDGSESRITWSSDGLPASVTDAGGNTTHYEWLAGSLTAITDADGRRTEFQLDDVGRTVATINPDGGISRTAYSPANEVTSLTDPLGRKTGLNYDRNGNLTAITAPSGSTWTWGYDRMDRVVEETDPNGKSTTYTYDQLGRPVTMSDRRGVTTVYKYDELGRQIFTGWTEPGADDFESTQTFGYDDRDRLVSVKDSAPGAGELRFSYDGWDRIVKETTTAGGGSGSVTRRWDDGDRLVSTQVSGLPEVHYSYDRNDRVVAVSQGVARSEFTYAPDGMVKSQTLPGGVTRLNDYDGTGALTRIRYAQGSKALGSLTYAYDPAGRLSGVGGSWSKADLPGVFDDVKVSAGSRVSKSGGSRIEYDADGNVVKVEDPKGKETTYRWDARGRLVGIDGPGGESRISYDAAGRRTATTIDGKDYGFRYDGHELAAQDAPGDDQDLAFARGLGTDSAFAVITGAGDGRPDASGDPGALLTDRLGSVVARMEPGSANVAALYAYGPYGKPSGPGDANPVRYTGRESGAGVPAGLQYQRARWYDPQLGRFLSEDPTGHGGSGTNLYSYAGSDPLDATDPTGEMPQLVGACLAGGAINTVAGMLLGRKHSVGDYLRGFGKGCVEGLLMFGAGKAAQLTLRTAMKLARSAAEVTPIGFAEGEGATALTARRLQHGTAHLVEKGILPKWSGKQSPSLIRQALVPILEHPSATFDDVIRGQKSVKGFLGEVGGEPVVVMIYKDGKFAGELATSFVPKVSQLANWGLI